MALTQTQQIKNLVSESNNVFVTFRDSYDGDVICASLAAGLFLEKLGKKVTVVRPNFSLPSEYQFLKDAHRISSLTPVLRRAMISLETNGRGLPGLSYEEKNGRLNIFISPSRQEKAEIKYQNRFELIFILGTPDFHSLGDLFHQNTDFFYGAPIINIDYHPQNERMGQINLVDLTATSNSEVVWGLINSLDSQEIDEELATVVLAGIIHKTDCFRREHLHPNCLNLASELIALGARREEIINNLYRNKTTENLKLWGKIFASLKEAREGKMVLCSLDKETKIEKNELDAVTNELFLILPKMELIIFFMEKADGIECYLKSSNYSTFNLLPLAAHFNFIPVAGEAGFFIKSKNLFQAEEKIKEKIK